jgi:3',5'-cyclic AMP phosphodiesterase CpdA
MTVIAHISDPHFGTEDPAIVAGLLADLDGTTAPRPSLVAVSGDLTQRARMGQFRASRAFLDRMGCPYLVVPGNHDVPLYNILGRFFDPLGSYRAAITDDLAPTYADDTIAVAGIATAHGFTMKSGRVRHDQIAAAVASLAAFPTAWKVIVAHHPFVGPERASRDLVDGAEEALAAFRAAGVNMILTGHLHISFSDDAAMRDETHRIVAVHAGTCTSTRTRGEPNNYNRITFAGDEVTVLVRMWDGTAFIDGDAKTYRRGAGAVLHKTA